MHSIVDIGLGSLCSACGWLIVRLIGRIDALEKRAQESSEADIRIEAAIRRVEERLGISNYPISAGSD